MQLLPLPLDFCAGGVARDETTSVAHERRRCCLLLSPTERGDTTGLLASAEMASAAEGAATVGCEEKDDGDLKSHGRIGGAGGIMLPLPLLNELFPFPSSNRRDEKEAAVALFRETRPVLLSFALLAPVAVVGLVIVVGREISSFAVLAFAAFDAPRESMNLRRESAFGNTRPELTQASTAGLSGDFDLDRLRCLPLDEEVELGLRCRSLPLPLCGELDLASPPGLQLCADDGVITTMPLGEQRIVAPGNKEAR